MFSTSNLFIMNRNLSKMAVCVLAGAAAVSVFAGNRSDDNFIKTANTQAFETDFTSAAE